MTPKDLTTLKAALKILKKGHKPCKTFVIGCGNCQYKLMVGILNDAIEDHEDTLDYRKFIAKNIKQ